MPKSCGGLCVLDLEIMNKCLLIKWLWKLENTEGVSRAHHQKLFIRTTLVWLELWRGWLTLMARLDECESVIGNGAKTLFLGG